MSNWDDDEDEQWSKATASSNNTVKDSWDDDDVVKEEVKKEPPKPTVKPLTKKEALKKAIELKEKEEKLKGTTSDYDVYMEEQKKKQLQEASDLEHANSLFSGLSTTDTGVLSGFTPSSEKDFEKYAGIISDYITKYDASFHFPSFFKALIRKSLANVNSATINDISKVLTVMLNDKIKSEKAGTNKNKSKAAGKSSIKMDKAIQTFDDLSEEDDDDFM
ncbi:eukaryotic translation initiation factor 3 subunit 1 [Tieghemostelium lacteum]|uniref:Eukaryotic translation initiation factor 3 subunit 1 n=1 Tax=Tieghemostelium lacteum TaxID=361077 RepID=A0A151Z4Q3_TIELA|nr:eukaryotic translation initiation factor 3 subunit 1 [Tieghemostelium lacteum]|eukprot:KYQ88918.1 eukaryotic translation initiation factor 3 subunit 1 [Tieghemostelium lacteum]